MIKTAFALPRFILRGQSVVLSMPIYADDATPYPVTSGSLIVYDADKTVIATGVATITAGVPTFALTGAATTAQALSAEWQEEWTLVVDGETHIVRRDAHLCLRLTYPSVTVATLVQRVPDINALRPSNIASWGPTIDRAWEKVQRRILDGGKMPYLVLNSGVMQDLLEYTTLGDIFETFAQYMGDEGRYAKLATKYMADADDAYGRLRFAYDAEQTNIPEDAEYDHNKAPVNTPAAAYDWGRNGF